MMMKTPWPKQAGHMLPGILCAILIWHAGVGEVRAACNAGNILYTTLTIELSKDVVCTGGTVTATVTTDPPGANVTLTSIPSIPSKISITPTVGLPGVFTITGDTESDAPKDVPLVATIISGVETDPEVVSCIETSSITVLKVDIKRDGVSIAWSTNTVNVGEHIALTGTLEPALTVSSNLWSIPGTRIKSYTMSENLGETNGLTPSDLLAPNVAFYWIDDGTTLQVDYTVFAAGITCSASTWFTVIRPTAALLSVTTTNSPAVNVSTNYWTGEETNHWMHFGNETSPGITWTGLVATAAGGSGEIGFIQLIQEEGRSVESNGTAWVLSSSNQFVLDGTPPAILYDDGPEAHKSIGDSDAEYIDSNDTPGINLDSPEYDLVSADISNNFRVYLMYRPTGIDSIWVTLRKMEWYWHGAVTNNGGWSMLPGASSSSSPSGSDSIELPTWKNHAVNINYEEE